MPEGHPLETVPRQFLERVGPKIEKKLKDQLRALKSVKFPLALKEAFRKDGPDGAEERVEPVLRHKQSALLQPSEIGAALDVAVPRLLETLERLTQRGSGWVVARVATLWLDIAWYQPLRGGSYIDLPAALKCKKAVINVKNNNDNCLRWAPRSALFPVHKDPQSPTKYPAEDGLCFTGIDAPTPIFQINWVECQNNLAINVLGWDKGVTRVHRLSKKEGPWINLLIIK